MVTASALDKSGYFVPGSIISIDQNKLNSLIRAGFRQQILDFIGMHLNGDPGDVLPAMTTAINAATGPSSFCSCFRLSNGKRVTIHSDFNPDGTISDFLLRLP